MKIVITHVKADFDAIASAYAAYKLHSCDAIYISSSYESNIEAFIQDSGFNLPISTLSSSQIGEIKELDTLIITDCCTKNRLGALAALIDISKEIIIYDHHITSNSDIQTDNKHILPYGSSSSILALELEKSGMKLSSLEATFLSLGIYEDTGLLTFSSTCKQDFLACAFLATNKPELIFVKQYINRELRPVEVLLLSQLVLNFKLITVNGVNVGYSFATVDEYVDEASHLANKLMNTEGVSSLFIIIESAGKLYLVGRSNDKYVDVYKVVREFGGGGHAYAGSATIKDKVLVETLDLLKYVIRQTIKPIKTVSEIMTTHVKSVEYSCLLQDALDFMARYNLNSMPITDEGRCVGIISRKEIVRGVRHKLGSETVGSIMQTEFEVVSPKTQFYEAEEILLYHQKLLPVEQNDSLVGVLTRTDLMRLMHENPGIHSDAVDMMRESLGVSTEENYASKLEENLPPEVLYILKDIGGRAEKWGYKAYVVGGFVRDLVLHRKNLDIDIVIEGNAPEFVKKYAQTLENPKLFIHEKFKTAVLTLENEFKIDFATARREYYTMPATSPQVEAASLKSDLFRRDFTINAMAIRIDGEHFGELLDFFLGRKDIVDKKIRVLHAMSIVDDPSRALRAVRFAMRFGFTIGNQTDRLIKHAENLNLFRKVPASRMYLELKYILAEPCYRASIALLSKYNIMRFYERTFQFDQDLSQKLERAEEVMSKFEESHPDEPFSTHRVRFLVLFCKIKGTTFDKFIDRLDIMQKEATLYKEDNKRIEYAAALLKRYHNRSKPSFIFGICQNMSADSLLALIAIIGSDKATLVYDYIEKYRYIKISLNGKDLLELGVPKGEKVASALKSLQNAKLDGIVNSEAEEREYIIREFVS